MYREEYLSDCETIQDIVYVNRKASLTLQECYKLWRAYGETMAAGWLIFDKDKDTDSVLYMFDKMDFLSQEGTFLDWWKKNQDDICKNCETYSDAEIAKEIAEKAYEAGRNSLR